VKDLDEWRILFASSDEDKYLLNYFFFFVKLDIVRGNQTISYLSE